MLIRLIVAIISRRHTRANIELCTSRVSFYLSLNLDKAGRKKGEGRSPARADSAPRVRVRPASSTLTVTPRVP